MVELENVGDSLNISKSSTAVDEGLDALLGAADSLGNLVNVLGLNDSLEIIFKQLGEVV